MEASHSLFVPSVLTLSVIQWSSAIPCLFFELVSVNYWLICCRRNSRGSNKIGVATSQEEKGEEIGVALTNGNRTKDKTPSNVRLLKLNNNHTQKS